jgi:hypothetical protein
MSQQPRPNHPEYTATFRAEAIGLALSIGGNEAADRLGMPRRTLHNWLHGEGAPVIREKTQQAIETRLWNAFSDGVDALQAALKKPGSHRLSEVARAVEVLQHSHALITGRPTEYSRVDILPNEWTSDREELRQALSDVVDFNERLKAAGLLDIYTDEMAAVTEKYTQLLAVSTAVTVIDPPRLVAGPA